MPKLTLEDGTDFTGKLILVGDDGSKMPFDPVKTHSTFGEIRGERDRFQSEAQKALARLQQFGKDDSEIEDALAKLKLARGLDDKKLVDAGKVEELKNQAIASYKAERDKEAAELKKQLEASNARYEESLVNAFSGSKVLSEYLPTWSLLRHELRNRIAVENGQLVGYRDADKKDKFYSAANPGQLAQGDELLKMLLASHPDHDSWKKGSGAAGTGAPGNPGGGGGAKTMTVDQFNALSAQARMDFINKEDGKVV